MVDQRRWRRAGDCMLCKKAKGCDKPAFIGNTQTFHDIKIFNNSTSSSAPLFTLPGLDCQHATMQLRPKMNQICCCGTWIILVWRPPAARATDGGADTFYYADRDSASSRPSLGAADLVFLPSPWPSSQLPATPVCMLTDIKMCWIISVGVVQLAAPTFINIYNFFPTHPNIVLLVAGVKSCQQDFAKFHAV